MVEVLSHRLKHGEDATRAAMYRLLFNSGLMSLALLALLAICLLFVMTQNAL